MSGARYSVRVGESHCIAEGISYDALLERIVEFTIRAAVARTIDESEWEHEELRRKGLGALQIFHNERAVWDDGAIFETELEEARRERACTRFKSANELDAAFYRKLDEDLRARWQRAGYAVASMRHDMKPLFSELERDLSERCAGAREALLNEILREQSQESV
jgi:hypothetical protein